MKQLILVFNISKTEIFRIKLNMNTKTSEILYEGSDLSLHPILDKSERTYYGIEHRLQWMLHTEKSLPEIIKDIEADGFRYDAQNNLNIDVIHI